MKLLLIFIAALTLDGLIFPALFGFKESLLSVLVIVMSLVFFGVTSRSVVYGLIFSIIYELAHGLNFGILVVPFLFTAVTAFFIQKFLDTKSKYFLALAPMVFAYLLLVFYNRGGISAGYFSPTVILIVVIESLTLAVIFSNIFGRNNHKSNV